MKNIIIAGCGGGCDIFGGIPLYLSLKKHNIILTNLSFTKKSLLDTCESHVEKITDTMYVVDAQKTNFSYKYFPEYYLSRELNTKVYILLQKCTINDLKTNYEIIMNIYKNIYHIYLVDGGCDVLLSGKETELASPVEDMMHLKAISCLNIENKYVCAIGMNIDVGHGVIEDELIDRLKYLEETNVLLDKYVWIKTNEYVKQYYNIINNVIKDTSIVHCLICACLNGFVGHYVPPILKSRISESLVFLSELTRTFCIFDLEKLIKTILYFNKLELYMDSENVDDMIEKFVHDIKN